MGSFTVNGLGIQAGGKGGGMFLGFCFYEFSVFADNAQFCCLYDAYNVDDYRGRMISWVQFASLCLYG